MQQQSKFVRAYHAIFGWPSYFASIGDKVKVFLLNVERRVGHKLHWTAGPVVSLNLKSSKAPFFVRRRTSDLPTLNELMIAGEYADTISALRPNTIVLDLGANIGLSARLWCDAGAKKVIAIEPSSANCAVARMNIGEEHLKSGRVVLIEAAVGPESGTLWLDDDTQEGAWALKTHKDGGANRRQVRQMSVPEILTAAGVVPGEPIHLLKCDIEGAEADLFSHASTRHWLGSVEHLVIETHTPYMPDHLVRDLSSHGIEMHERSRIPGVHQSTLHFELKGASA